VVFTLNACFNGRSPILCDRLPTFSWSYYCLYYVVVGFMDVLPLSVLF